MFFLKIRRSHCPPRKDAKVFMSTESISIYDYGKYLKQNNTKTSKTDQFWSENNV